MSKLDDLMTGGNKVPKKGRPVYGTFQCQECWNDDCDEAEYFPQEKLLVWKCPEGHDSMLEEFNL